MKKLLSRPQVILAVSGVIMLFALINAYQTAGIAPAAQPVKTAMVLPIGSSIKPMAKTAIQPASIEHPAITSAMLERMVDAAPAPREQISRVELSSHALFEAGQN